MTSRVEALERQLAETNEAVAALTERITVLAHQLRKDTA